MAHLARWARWIGGGVAYWNLGLVLLVVLAGWLTGSIAGWASWLDFPSACEGIPHSFCPSEDVIESFSTKSMERMLEALDTCRLERLQPFAAGSTNCTVI